MDQAAEDRDFYYSRSLAVAGAVGNLLTVPLTRLWIMAEPLARRRLYARSRPRCSRQVRPEEVHPRGPARPRRPRRACLTDGFRRLRQVSETDRLLRTSPSRSVSATGGGMRAQITASHQRLAGFAPAGPHVWAEGGGHMVPRRRPDLVVEEARALMGQGPGEPRPSSAPER